MTAVSADSDRPPADRNSDITDSGDTADGNRVSGAQTAPRRMTEPRRDNHTGQALSAATEPEEGSADIARIGRDTNYAYHLDRVTKKFKAVISADNMNMLARLLGGDDGG